MGQISLQVPQVGLSDSTEDVKVANNFTTLQNTINGNLDDTNLASPNNSVRRLLVQGGTAVTAGMIAGDYVIGTSTGNVPSASNAAFAVALWPGDNGYSSQPQDFQVANKSALGRIRASLAVNAVAPAVTITFGLYAITAFGGASSTVAYTFGSAVAGTTVAKASPAANSFFGVESAAFTLPSAATAYALGFNLNGTTAANSTVHCIVQLYSYNA